MGLSSYTDDMCPLQYAAALGSARAVSSLLECGADFSLKDEEGQTALDIAKGLDREVVGVLMAWSGDV
jgi:ankyrin repeat protein